MQPETNWPQHVCCCSASGDTNLIWRPISAQPSESTAASLPATDPREGRKYLALDLARNAVYICTTRLSWPREYPGTWVEVLRVREAKVTGAYAVRSHHSPTRPREILPSFSFPGQVTSSPERPVISHARV